MSHFALEPMATKPTATARLWRAIAIAGGILLGGMALNAAAQQPQGQVPPPAQQQNNYSDEQLKSFAVASLRVDELNAAWAPKINEAGSTAESAAMRQEAMEEMMEAVRDEGLSVQEYNQINSAAQTDPAVADKVRDYRQNLQ